MKKMKAVCKIQDRQEAKPNLSKNNPHRAASALKLESLKRAPGLRR
jgi:hypothetical protein